VVRAERLRVAAPRFGSRIARRLEFDSEFDCEFEFASDFQWIPVSAWFVFSNSGRAVVLADGHHGGSPNFQPCESVPPAAPQHRPTTNQLLPISFGAPNSHQPRRGKRSEHPPAAEVNLGVITVFCGEDGQSGRLHKGVITFLPIPTGLNQSAQGWSVATTLGYEKQIQQP
jgi:hypothetical protein